MLIPAASLASRFAALPPLYVVIWLALAMASLVLLVLLFTRWGKARPLHRCAVLSLVAHLMLACLLLSVGFLSGGGGSPPSQAPIRVRLVEGPPSVAIESAEEEEEQPEETVAASTAAIDIETQASDEDAEPDSAESAQLEPTNPGKAGPLDGAPPEPESDAFGSNEVEAATTPNDPSPTVPIPLPEAAQAELAEKPPESSVPVAEPPSFDASQAVEGEKGQVAEIASDLRPTEAPSQQHANKPVPDDRAAISNSEPLPPTTSAAQPPIHPSAPPQASPTLPSRYTLRSRPDRLSWVEGQGGGRDTERAVQAALEWLAAAQEPDGCWNAHRHGAGQERRVLGHDRRGAGMNADTGITGLAVLAFLGAGHSHQQGDYQATVARGLEFLIRQQDSTGDLGGDASLYARMYCHSMAAFAITEALAMTGDARLRPAAQRALTYSLRAQHPSTGGWRYRVGDTGDTSQLGWQVMALSSAEHAGLRVPWRAWDGVQRFLDSVARGSEGGLASYRPDSPASRAMTAEAFYCRQVVGTMGGQTHGRRAADEAAQAVLGEMPHAGRINLYYWYYATLALHHAQSQDEAALAAWSQWNAALKRVLVTTQVARGSDAGSWSPETVWGGYGGRVYSTALAAMCLEVYYRYPAAPATRRDIASGPASRER